MYPGYITIVIVHIIVNSQCLAYHHNSIIFTIARPNMCMYVCTYVCTYVCMYVCTYVRMYVRTYVRMYVCMYVCMYVASLHSKQ